MPRQVVHPPFLPQLHHARVDPREPRPGLFPRREPRFVPGPRNLPTYPVPRHSVVVWSAVGGEVVKLPPQQLALERLRRLAVLPFQRLIEHDAQLVPEGPRGDAAELEVRGQRRGTRRHERLGVDLLWTSSYFSLSRVERVSGLRSPRTLAKHGRPQVRRVRRGLLKLRDVLRPVEHLAEPEQSLRLAASSREALVRGQRRVAELFQRGYPRAGDDIPEHFNQVTVRVRLHGWDVGHVWGHRRHGPTAVRDFEKGRVRGGRFAVFAFSEEFLDVPEGVGDGDVDLGADRLGGFVDRGVALLRVRLGVELVAQPVASPRLERCGDDAFRIAVQHEERRSFGPE